MSYSVSLTDDAATDLEELIEYRGAHDSPASSDRVLDQFERALSSLSRNPERGAYPGELYAIGVREYREVFFKPYRIIYRVIGNEVLVLLIADGRRDMQSLLERRLVEGRP